MDNTSYINHSKYSFQNYLPLKFLSLLAIDKYLYRDILTLKFVTNIKIVTVWKSMKETVYMTTVYIRIQVFGMQILVGI